MDSANFRAIKAEYRRVLKSTWNDRKSYDQNAAYDPKTITDLIYFNTCKMVFSHIRPASNN